MLPDIDSSNARSKSIIFNLLAFIGIYFYSLRFDAINSFRAIIEILMLYLSIRFGISSLISRCCIHRGIFHSIPMMLIWCYSFSLVGIFVLHTNTIESWNITFMLGVGFISHLVLDEIYSVNLAGLKLKKSFGSALKLWSKNLYPTLFVYTVMTLLFFIMPPLAPSVKLITGNLHLYQEMYRSFQISDITFP